MNNMKRTTLSIMKKECRRIFTDRRLFFTTVILPGLMMFILYSIMGSFIANLFAVDEEHLFQVHVVNLPNSAAELFAPDELQLQIIPTNEAGINEVIQRLTDRQTDILIVFPSNFDAEVAAFDVATATTPAPNVQIWANTAHSTSHQARHIVTTILNDYHHALTHRFSINAPTEYTNEDDFDLATEADVFAMAIGIMIPMVFIIVIFSGSQAIVPESIAGEKERGTLGSMLVTPACRSGMALGKILGLGVFALLSALVSMLGIILSAPIMLGMSASNLFDFYSIADFVLLLLVSISTTLIAVSLLSVLSALAKSVKEANAFAMPLTFIIIVTGFVGLLLGGAPDEFFFYLIPVVNSALSITAVFSFDVNVVNVLITVATNIAISLIFAFVLAKIFNSEKIVFDK